VQDHVLKRRVSIVSMSVPPVGSEIDLDVPGAGRFSANLQNGASKIGSAFVTPKPRMQHLHRLALRRDKFIAQNTLMEPNKLEQPFGRRCRILSKERGESASLAPLDVKIDLRKQHGSLLVEVASAKVKPCFVAASKRLESS
jgi:hypothetical protein